MPERVDADSTEKIEVALALRIPQVYSAPVSEEDLLAIVGRQQ